MKKSLLVLPAVLLLLAACTPPAGGGGGGGDTSTSGGGGVTPVTVLKLDFTTAVQGELIALDGATEKLMSFKTAGEATATVDAIDRVYEGNGTGGAHPNSGGLLKLGTSSINGLLTLTLSAPASKVIVNCHTWYTLNPEYPDSVPDSLKVNSSAPLALPFNATGAGEDLEFTISSTTVTLETVPGSGASGRAFFFSLTFIA